MKERLADSWKYLPSKKQGTKPHTFDVDDNVLVAVGLQVWPQLQETGGCTMMDTASAG